MELMLFFKGIVIGFGMAVPIGPIGILCVRKTLAEGQVRGWFIGLGGATADMIFAGIAAFGLTVVSSTLFNQRIWIRLVGGVLLLYLGLRIYNAKPAIAKDEVQSGGLFRSYFSTLLLTLTNPFTIFAFMAVFASFGLVKGLDIYSVNSLITGVFIGSGLWFLTLSTGVTIFRKKMDLTGLRRVNKAAGILIILSAFISVASLF